MSRRKSLILLLPVLLVLVAGCTNPLEGIMGTAGENETVELGEVANCNPPYIKTETGCCPDSDENGDCDVVEDEESCGDNVCTSEENSTSCCKDCGCAGSNVCVDNECNPKSTFELANISALIIDKPLFIAEFCGNGVCGGSETQESCCKDCGCPVGQMCSNSTCSPILFKPLLIQPILIPIGGGGGSEIKTTSYIVAVLESIKTKQNGDGSGKQGELQFFSEAISGSKTQRIKWPIGAYHAVRDNSIVLAGAEEALPLFAVKEDEMGDALTIDFFASDLDTGPVLPAIDDYTSLEDVNTLFSKKICKHKSSFGTRLASFMVMGPFGALVDLFKKKDCNDNDMLGRYKAIHNRAQDWGVGQEYVYESPAMAAVFRYSIHRVEAPDNMELDVNLKNVQVVQDGDSGTNRGDIQVWTRVSDGFVKDSFGVGMQTQHQWPRGFGPYTMTDGDSKAFNINLAHIENAGPFLYIEVDVFDRDKDCRNYNDFNYYPCYATSKFDDVGILSYLLLLNSDEITKNPSSTVTIPIYETVTGSGQSAVKLEIVRKPLGS